ncbi:TniB family NTP-binding protein [Rubrivivax albus]|uniref:Uncharacterized protein n=1 Tax=Rubrivivax albus TaxID=2499835 RepID=A0A3S2TYJ0_9BURK|nr:TniB family NTP-binding protein [Rubrivivax albus]RVT47459.1 hypothetical protein ENE75_24145 [Rubrivivax albus]
MPTYQLATIATQIHRMLIGGLIDRDPYSPEQKRRLHQLAYGAQRGVLDVPWVNAASRGMRIEGITKQGKTQLIKRVLSQYPQVIRRGENTEAGWIELVQLVYLVIPMPTDATKGGFLMQAFIELDRILGTTYARDTKIRDSSIDSQLVQLLAKLAMHRCGLLVVEEAQETNQLATTKFGSDFGTFFLRVLNAGIPTILMGNPNAFTELDTSSQLMGRLSDAGLHELQPTASPTANEWTDDFVPGIWGKNLLPEADEPIDDLPVKLHAWTGGFKHYLNVLRREATMSAIQRKGSHVAQRDIALALQSSAMVEGRKIIDSYLSGLKGGETQFTDIPGLPGEALRRTQPKRRRRSG